MMRIVHKHFVLCLIFVLIFSLTGSAWASPTLPPQARAFNRQVAPSITGGYAYEVVEHLAVSIGTRRSGTEEEAEAAEYIKGEFEAMGYQVEMQPFTTDITRRCRIEGTLHTWTETIESANVVATKPGRGKGTVILGAHMDSKTWNDHCPGFEGPESMGAGDNASGVGVMLEVARFLAGYPTQATIIFIAFGAEEVGLLGSKYYVSQMSQKDIANTVAMVNLDMVGIGYPFNVYSGLEGETWVRDLALGIGQRMGHDIRTRNNCVVVDGEEICDEWMPYGTSGDWSDHAPFRWVGIPVAYFEWWYWDEDPFWGIERPGIDEDIYHTPADTIDEVSQWKLEATGEVVAALIYEIARNPMPRNQKGMLARARRYIAQPSFAK